VKKTAALLLAFAALGASGGCAAPPSPAGPAFPCESSLTDCVPAFYADGRVRRDLATDAPLFTAPAEALAALAPRFNDDGTVCRDPESGTPLYEEVCCGEVVRVLVLPSR
jgi:hypothetical protein